MESEMERERWRVRWRGTLMYPKVRGRREKGKEGEREDEEDNCIG